MCSHLAPVIRRSGDTLTHPFFEEHIYDSLGPRARPLRPSAAHASRNSAARAAAPAHLQELLKLFRQLLVLLGKLLQGRRDKTFTEDTALTFEPCRPLPPPDRHLGERSLARLVLNPKPGRNFNSGRGAERTDLFSIRDQLLLVLILLRLLVRCSCDASARRAVGLVPWATAVYNAGAPLCTHARIAALFHGAGAHAQEGRNLSRRLFPQLISASPPALQRSPCGRDRPAQPLTGLGRRRLLG